LAALQGHYDASIAYADEQVGALIDALAGRGVLEDTAVIILSDHGEHFGEHGLMLHGGSLYTQEIHVPLLISHPSLVPSGQAVAAPASLRNIAATAVELAGLAGDAPFPGMSLSRMWAGEPSGDPVLSEADQVQHLSERYPAAQGRLASLVQGSLHYIRREFDGGEELYDLEGDPAEANDLAAQAAYQTELAEMRAALQAALAA
jgi:arylsulfatase A-like enzyme